MEANRLIEIDPVRCLRALVKNLKWIIMSGLLFFAVGILFALFTQEKRDIYTTTANIYSITDSGYYSETYDGTILMMSYADMVTSPTVLDRANRMLGNRYTESTYMANLISIERGSDAVLDSGILKVRATGTDKTEIVEVANAVADAFVIEMSHIMENGEVRVLDHAQFAELKVRAQENIILITAVATVLGIGFACVVIVFMEIFSNRLITVKDGTLFGKLNIIGVIPDYSEVSEDGKHRISVGEEE